MDTGSGYMGVGHLYSDLRFEGMFEQLENV